MQNMVLKNASKVCFSQEYILYFLFSHLLHFSITQKKYSRQKKSVYKETESTRIVCCLSIINCGSYLLKKKGIKLAGNISSLIIPKRVG